MYITLAFIFLLFAMATIAYIFFKENVDSFFVKKRFSPLIFHESSKLIDISGKNKDNIFSSIKDEINTQKREPKEVEGVYFLENKKTVGFYRFLSLIESNFTGPSDLFEDNFLVGIIKQSEKTEIIEEKSDINNPENLIGTKKLLDDYVTLSATTFFKPGTNEFINIESKNKAKELIGYFLDVFSIEDSKIKIIGTFSTERPEDKNQEIAEIRKKLGLNLLNEVLKEKYTEDQISKIAIETLYKGVSLTDIYTTEELEKMSQAEKNEKIELNQGIQYLAETKVKPLINNTSNQTTTILQVPNITKEIISTLPKNTDVFILLKVDSFGDVFNQMRIWENKMFTDLHSFFGIDLFADTSYLLTKDFTDGVIQNKNARILYDSTGKIVFMYVYIDESSIVITNTEEATREVILRVNSSKIKK